MAFDGLKQAVSPRQTLRDANHLATRQLHELTATGMEHEKDSAGRIVHTSFRCRKFDDWTAVEQYLKTGDGAFEEISYENEGDIFRAFDSYSYFGEFLPKDGQDFKLLPFMGEAGKKNADAVFYGTAEPAAYRGKSSK